jgi:hypothetical protein
MQHLHKAEDSGLSARPLRSKAATQAEKREAGHTFVQAAERVRSSRDGEPMPLGAVQHFRPGWMIAPRDADWETAERPVTHPPCSGLASVATTSHRAAEGPKLLQRAARARESAGAPALKPGCQAAAESRASSRARALSPPPPREWTAALLPVNTFRRRLTFRNVYREAPTRPCCVKIGRQSKRRYGEQRWWLEGRASGNCRIFADAPIVVVPAVSCTAPRGRGRGRSWVPRGVLPGIAPFSVCQAVRAGRKLAPHSEAREHPATHDSDRIRGSGRSRGRGCGLGHGGSPSGGGGDCVRVRGGGDHDAGGPYENDLDYWWTSAVGGVTLRYVTPTVGCAVDCDHGPCAARLSAAAPVA